MNSKELEHIINILDQCSWKFSAKFNYKNKEGKKSQKHVEVYDLDKVKKSFFGWDLEKNCIRSYGIESMCDFIEIGEEFIPRFKRK